MFVTGNGLRYFILADSVTLPTDFPHTFFLDNITFFVISNCQCTKLSIEWPASFDHATLLGILTLDAGVAIASH